MVDRCEQITEQILTEARRRWRTGIGADLLAPSVAISILKPGKWYGSIVRWPRRGTKVVERKAEGESMLAVLTALAENFIAINPKADDECSCNGGGCSVCTGIPGFDGYGSGS